MLRKVKVEVANARQTTYNDLPVRMDRKRMIYTG